MSPNDLSSLVEPHVVVDIQTLDRLIDMRHQTLQTLSIIHTRNTENTQPDSYCIAIRPWTRNAAVEA